MSSSYVCNLIVPGAAKSGTSTLHELLDLHPQISMSTSKEPHHFCRSERFKLGAERHNALFDKSSEISFYGESSTGYLPWPEAAYRAKQNLDDPKIIMVLREPVERTLSHYRWRYQLGLEKRSFLEALREDGRGYDPERPTEYGYTAYLDFSNYSRHCEHWLSVFGRENCLLMDSVQLRQDKSEALEWCFSFLGLPAISLAEMPEDANTTNALGRRSPKVVTRAAKLIPSSLKESEFYIKFRAGILRSAASSPPSEITNEERRFLRTALAEDIEWFQSQFGRG